MKTLSCAATRQRLSAFCDRELVLADQMAVEAHLTHCEACAAEVRVTDELGRTLRMGSAALIDRCEEDLAALQAAVLARVKAERATSVVRQIDELFEDMHLVWAAASGIIATVVCATLAFGMVRVVKTHPESLAALVDTLSRTPVVPEPFVLPRVSPDAVMPATAMSQQSGDDGAFALAAVVMADGSLSGIEVLRDESVSAVRTAREERLAGDLLDAVSTARFEPGRMAGTPVPVNVVWLLTHTTVRGKAGGLRAKAVSASPISRRIGRLPSSQFETLAFLSPAGRPILAGETGRG
jgi:Putative zinc-finger